MANMIYPKLHFYMQSCSLLFQNAHYASIINKKINSIIPIFKVLYKFPDTFEII